MYDLEQSLPSFGCPTGRIDSRTIDGFSNHCSQLSLRIPDERGRPF